MTIIFDYGGSSFQVSAVRFALRLHIHVDGSSTAQERDKSHVIFALPKDLILDLNGVSSVSLGSCLNDFSHPNNLDKTT